MGELGLVWHRVGVFAEEARAHGHPSLMRCECTLTSKDL